MTSSMLSLLALVGVASGVLVLKEASYLRLPDKNGNYIINSGTARDSAFDSSSRYLYVVGRDTGMLHVVDLTDFASPYEMYSHSFDLAIDGRPLDVELCRGVGVTTLAISFEGIDSVSFAGKVGLYHLFESTTDTLKPINPLETFFKVGAHPDDMSFTKDCHKLVVACEGEPRVVENVFNDPEGSVHIVTVPATADTLPTVDTVNFREYDDPTKLGPLLQENVRYWLRRDPTDSSRLITFSQNVEPEYVAISPNDGYAYVTLQENNAIARIDISNGLLTNIYPMGIKDWSLLTMDTSDRDNAIRLKNRNIKSFYQPDKAVFFTYFQTPYLLTMDEGKASNLPGVTPAYQDYARANSRTWDTQDTELNAELAKDSELGRLHVSMNEGVDTVPEVPIAFGGRGFSIWETQSMQRIYESGDEFERLSQQHFPQVFNGDCSTFSQTPVQQVDQRSTWNGPEVSNVALGPYHGHIAIIMGSSRNGVLYVWTLIPTVNIPIPDFQSMHRAGRTDATWSHLYNEVEMGDAVITDIDFAQGGHPLVIVTSQVSGSISVYELNDEAWSGPSHAANDEVEYDDE